MYLLKISTDFGIKYYIEMGNDNLDVLKQEALKLEKRKDVRWVIVNVDDMPIYWSVYLEASLSTPPDAAIATDDLYVRKLAEKQGRKVLSTLDLLRSMGVNHVTQKDLDKIEMNPENIKATCKEIQKSVDEGVIEEDEGKYLLNILQLIETHKS